MAGASGPVTKAPQRVPGWAVRGVLLVSRSGPRRPRSRQRPDRKDPTHAGQALAQAVRAGRRGHGGGAGLGPGIGSRSCAPATPPAPTPARSSTTTPTWSTAAGQDRPDGLGGLPGRALEADRQGDRRRARRRAGSAEDTKGAEFDKNRDDVVSRCIERGINYIDACSPEEVIAYAKVLKGRRDKMYLGFSWGSHEMRNPEWRPRKKLKQTLDDGLKQAGLDYVDLWRITCLEQSSPAHRRRDRGGDGRARLGQEDRPGPLHRHLLARPPAHQEADREVPRPARSDRHARTRPRPRSSPTRPASGRR